MVKFNGKKFLEFYKNNFKKMMILPVLIVIFAFVMIFVTVSQDGTPIHRDISLKGGLSAIINVQSTLGSEDLKLKLSEKFPDNSFSVSEILSGSTRSGYIVDTDLEEEKFKDYLAKEFGSSLNFKEGYSSNYISPTLSSAFFMQAVNILIISFVLMSIVIFAYFREFVPSFAVVLSALFDIIVTVGILDAFGVAISIAGIGALLMIIGYSIDTDVLLTNRLIREKGDNYFEKSLFAFKTGSLMTFTTFVASLVALLITNSEIIFEIALILFIGLLVDFISTWIQNLGLLLWWIEKKEGKLE